MEPLKLPLNQTFYYVAKPIPDIKAFDKVESNYICPRSFAPISSQTVFLSSAQGSSHCIEIAGILGLHEKYILYLRA